MPATSRADGSRHGFRTIRWLASGIPENGIISCDCPTLGSHHSTCRGCMSYIRLKLTSSTRKCIWEISWREKIFLRLWELPFRVLLEHRRSVWRRACQGRLHSIHYLEERDDLDLAVRIFFQEKYNLRNWTSFNGLWAQHFIWSTWCCEPERRVEKTWHGVTRIKAFTPVPWSSRAATLDSGHPTRIRKGGSIVKLAIPEFEIFEIIIPLCLQSPHKSN